MVAESQTLLDWFTNLFRDPQAQAAFEADPEGYLEECGFEDVTPEDVADVLPLVFEGQQLTGAGADTPAPGGGVSVDDEGIQLPEPQAGDTDLETVVRQIQHITNNYVVDQTTTSIDNSISQVVDNTGGNFQQTIDADPTIAVGEEATALSSDGDLTADISSVQVQGEGNIVSGGPLRIDDSNVVAGDVSESVLAEDIVGSNVATSGGTAGDGNLTGDVVGTGNAVGTGNLAQSGDGSAFGEGSAVQSGEGNVAGTGNVGVTGENSAASFGEGQAVGGLGNQAAQGGTTAFGEGDATSAGGNVSQLEGVTVDGGGALSTGGSAAGFNDADTSVETTDIDISGSQDTNVATDGSFSGDDEFTDASTTTVTDASTTELTELSTTTSEVVNSDNTAVQQEADSDDFNDFIGS